MNLFFRVFASSIKDCFDFVHASLSLGNVGLHEFVGPNNGCLLIDGKNWQLHDSVYFKQCGYSGFLRKGKVPKSMELTW